MISTTESENKAYWLCSVVRMLNLNVFVRSLLININNAYSNGYCK